MRNTCIPKTLGPCLGVLIYGTVPNSTANTPHSCTECNPNTTHCTGSESVKILSPAVMVCRRNFASSTLVLIFANAIFLSAGTRAINIGGLFPLISDHGSGNQELAAVMLAISQINNKTDGVADTLLTDFQARPPMLYIIVTAHSIKVSLTISHRSPDPANCEG